MNKLILMFVGILLVGSVFALTVTQTVTVEIVEGIAILYSPMQDQIYNTKRINFN